MRVCDDCTKELPDGAFMDVRSHWKNIKITICNNCARENMKRWAKTTLVGHKKAAEELSK